MRSGIILCAGLLMLACFSNLHAVDVKPPEAVNATKSAKLTPDESRLVELGETYSLTVE